MRKLVAAAFSLAVVFAANALLHYPEAPKSAQVDDYHGVQVADPYRWLEDDRSPQTAAWVAAENKLTFDWLGQIPWRSALRERLRALSNYARYTAPLHRGDLFFFSKNDGLQNQSVWYAQKGLDGAPEILLDPNKLSKDGTTRLGSVAVSHDGRYFAYGISAGGSDWQEAHVIEVTTRRQLPDQLNWLKASGLAWAGDGFFYSRYPTPPPGHEMDGKNEFQAVYFHQIGSPQNADKLVFEDKAHGQRFHSVRTTVDERFAFLTISDRGAGKKGNSLFYRDLSLPDSVFAPVVAEIGNDNYSVVDNVGPRFLIETDHLAPNKKVAQFDPAAKSWKDVLPEKPEALESAVTGGGKLFARYTKDVATQVQVYSLDGKLENTIALPAAGAANGFSGLKDEPFVFYNFTSFNYPPTILRYDTATRRSLVFHAPDIPGFNPANYENKEVFFPSKDGTKIPMFLVYKKGLKLDGSNPTLMTGYGGFNIAETPSFNSLRLALLEQGFVFASVNMRGGSEYGEKWHEGGSRLKKQNVFDDFIAAAEWLIAGKYTSPGHFAINGTSNGGLLIGAVINQRPELFRVAVPQAGVMDMLRFQNFTIGWNWIADYGSSAVASEFPLLRSYSPIHNVRVGARYPAVLITTADHDDRVVPAHSFKYAATMQANVSPERPVLIRIETNSGHAASSIGKQIEITVDVYAFIMQNLGITPKL